MIKSKEKKKKVNNKAEICCKNCRFFDKFAEQQREDNIIGACKANPPFPAPQQDPKKEKTNKLGVWPVVLGNFWCGIFEEKEN